MSPTEAIITQLRAALDTAISAPDDDAWYLAMHSIRDIAWEGKELVHAKRMIEYARSRPSLKRSVVHTAISDLQSLGISMDEIIATLKSVQEQSK